MTEDDAKAFLLGMYDRLIGEQPNQQTLDRYISDDFVAHSDGVTMNRQEFEGHLALLRKKLRSFDVKIKDVVTSEACIAAILIVDCFTDAELGSTIQINAFYFLRDEKISRLDEISQLIGGSEADRDLVAQSS